MYLTYLRRELAGRKKQTIIVASGLAIAIALVMIVNSLSAGVRDAQADSLASVYGVGTDLTVTGTPTQPGTGAEQGQRFDFTEAPGATSGTDTTVQSAQLRVSRMRGTLPSDTLQTVQKVSGVAAATSTLSLTNATFSGSFPGRGSNATGGEPGAGADAQSGTGQEGSGERGSHFGIDSFSVMGVDPSVTTVGPMSSVTISSGRALGAADTDAKVALVDSTYASTNSLKVGGTLTVASTPVTIVGIVSSSSSSADTASDVYIPLALAQSLSSAGDVVSTVYVKAGSASDISAVQAALAKAVPSATVNSEAQLAADVSGSLSSATGLITGLGWWLSLIVLAVALLLAVLFTIGGVSRRTREFGTLKAIGWSNSRVVGQVAGESVVQGLLGGAAGLLLGFIGIAIINVTSPTVGGGSFGGGRGFSANGTSGAAGGSGGGFARPGAGGLGRVASEITLHAPVTVWVVLAAVAVAILGGLLAGAFGGWRAARLSPAEALRAVN